MTVDEIDSIKSGDVPLLVIEKGTQAVDEVNTSAVSSAGVMWAAVPAYSLTPRQTSAEKPQFLYGTRRCWSDHRRRHSRLQFFPADLFVTDGHTAVSAILDIFASVVQDSISHAERGMSKNQRLQAEIKVWVAKTMSSLRRLRSS